MLLSQLTLPHLTTWTTWDQFRAVGLDMWHNALTPGSTTWPSASRGYMVPIYLDVQTTVNRLFVDCGTAASGTMDLGIYDWSYNRLCRATGGAGTTQTVTSDIQVVTPDTVLTLGPGRYRFALSIDNVIATVVRTAHSIPILRAAGVSQMSSAQSGGGLVTPWVPATISTAFLPLAGFTNLTTI